MHKHRHIKNVSFKAVGSVGLNVGGVLKMGTCQDSRSDARICTYPVGSGA